MSYTTCNLFKFKPIIGSGLTNLPDDIMVENGIYVYESENAYDIDIRWLCDYICGFSPDSVFIVYHSRYSNCSCDTTYANYIFSKHGVFEFNTETPQSGSDAIVDNDLIIRGYTNGEMFAWVDKMQDDFVIQKHAKWIGKKWGRRFECSICGSIWDGYGTALYAKQTMPYCSACGAKMDLE